MTASGRPRGFEADLALDAAVDVFWRRGYDGASLSELTAAMGINRPSLYAAFGDKAQLFQSALHRYVERNMGYVTDAL
ncbi:MAG: helix-turn-helix domain-containing protein, partial [Mycetocola sp.]